MFALGGSDDGGFDVGEIGDSLQYQGFDSFEKTGGGVWTLTGSTSAVTPWTLADGTLSVSSDDNLGAASGALTFDGGTLRVTGTGFTGITRDIVWSASGGSFDIADPDNVFTLGQDIVGFGDFSKAGVGTLMLTGDSRVGSFKLKAGTLGVDGGSVELTDPQSFVGQQAGDDASLVIDNGRTVSTAGKVHVGDMSGSKGSVVVTGDGSGFNVGDVTVGFAGEGTMSILDGGQLSAGSFINVGGGNYGQLGNGRLLIDGTDSRVQIDGEFVVAGSGNGSTGVATVSNGGALEATSAVWLGLGNASGSAAINIGAASADAIDAVAPGTLTALEVRFFGDNTSLNFNHTGDAYVFDTELESDIVGVGLVNHYAGTTALIGNNSYFSGKTTIYGGTLAVSNMLGGLLTVEDGGTLGGSGTIGTAVIWSGGMLAPGNSIGTLTVSGDLDFDAGAICQVEINDGGNVAGVNNDLADVAGQVNIGTDARVRVLAENGTDDGSTYAPDTSYTIIRSAAVVGGNFDPVVEHDFAFLDASLAYEPNEVLLNLSLKNPDPGTDLDPEPRPDFTTPALTPNQTASAGAFNGFDSSSPAYAQLVGASYNGARLAFDTASGEVHASGQQVIDETFALFQSSLGTNGAVGNAGAQVAPLAYGPEPGTAVASLLAIDDAATDTLAIQSAWLKPMGGRGVVEADGNAGQLNWWAGGLAAGYEGKAPMGTGTATFGLGLGYLVNGASVPSRQSTMDGQGGFAGIYGGWSDGALSLSGSLAYGATHVSTSRDIAVGAIAETAEADYWTQSVGIDLEGSYGFALTDAVTLSPVGTVRTAWSGHDGATETGAGALNATLDPANWWQLDTGLGLELAYETTLEDGGTLTLKGRAMWEHAFGDTRPNQTLALAGGGDPFTVAGPQAGRDRLKLGAGVSYQPNVSTTLSLDYNGSFFGDQQSRAGTAAVKVSF